MPDLDNFEEILQEFSVEVKEQLEQLENRLIEFEEHPQNKELLDAIFRHVHTIKGHAGFLEFMNLKKTAHLLEEVFDLLRLNKMTISDQVMDTIMEGMDLLRIIVDLLEETPLEEKNVDISSTERAIQNLLANVNQDETNDESPTLTAPSQSPNESEITDSSNNFNDEWDHLPAPVTQDMPLEVPPDMEEILSDFILETEELLDTLDQDFIELENDPNNEELLNKIFRSAHTVKGSASFFGFTYIIEVSHKMEDVLNKMRRGEMAASPEAMDIILEARDMLLALVAEVRNRLQSKLDIRPILNKLVALYHNAPIPSTPSPSPQPAPSAPATPSDLPPSPQKQTDTQQKTLLKTRENLKSSLAETTIRVDIGRLDSLMNLVGELVGNRNRMIQLAKLLAEEFDDNEKIVQLGEAANQLDFITTELQDAVMHTRMLPVAKVFNKFPRMVRDLAKARNKNIDLVISGEDTELDKALVEEIGDPLIHIIRNSIDHGIEEEDARKAIGKDPRGKIYLSAFQEGNHIVIQIKDDGKGLDVEAIKQKAIERGTLDLEKAANLSQKEAMQLIFAPGLSTAKQVTDISGRGVGMDVVKTNIQKLNGIIEIDSELGIGTVITFKVPLTLAILPALLVRAQQEIYAIPLANILETAKIESSMIKTIEGCEVFNRRDMVISSIRLEKLFKIPSNHPTDNHSSKQYVVILGLAEERLGLIVDELIDQEEIVIKSMGNYLQEIEGISGAAVRGDGRVVLIMDVAASFKALDAYGKANRQMHI